MKRTIAIIGLGYAGLHTALAFGKIQEIIGYDVDKSRIQDLQRYHDKHGDFSKEILKESKIIYTFDPAKLRPCNFFVIIVPTPIKEDNIPDFSYLEHASELVGSLLKCGDIVCYESTVYPGATEEICVPILEKVSQLKFGRDFKIGYSPERINPGDSVHRFDNTVKIVSGSDQEALDIVADEYSKISKEIMRVSNIRTAEAVKITENIQRDTNIALMNELAIIFHLFQIDTEEVIKAAQTKWNFMPFRPGFVGGHCISVDPYYLIFKANKLGNSAELITSTRKINEYMSKYLCETAIKYLLQNKLVNENTKVAILGITYKENYDDIRNSKAVDLARELTSYGIEVFFTDPVATEMDVLSEYGIKLTPWEEIPVVSAIIIAVPHQEFLQLTIEQYSEKLLPKGLLMDVKSLLDPKKFSSSNIYIWRL